MNFSELLKNESIVGLLKQTGISEQQSESVLSTALSSINSFYKSDPKQTSSLLSSNPNTEQDNNLAGLIENDFVSNLINKFGLSETVANQAKSTMPEIMKTLSSNLTSSNSNDEGGIGNLLSSILGTENDSNNSTNSGFGGMLKNFLGSLFGKK